MLSVTELSGYELEPLREGGEYSLYRGRQAGGGVPILVVAPVAAPQASANLGRLEHEYALADQLDPAWAARPLGLARHDGRTVLVLEDPGGTPLDGMLDRPLGVERFLCLAIAAAVTLRQVHRRGVVHKDIKPANFLVDDADNVRLTGFGIASLLPRERQPLAPIEVIAGTFAYMAPEQTGRMNRSVDARSDLYSLGVTLYEMLTGALPFAASDPMEWIHCHIARQPIPPNERATGTPEPIAAIVLKLLAKTAEDRYQTAAGVEADLRRCLAAWTAHGRIDAFPLGENDASDQLLIPEKLYGREAETAALAAAFDRVVNHGAAEFVLVSGYAGIGKSSIVNELHKVLVAPRGLFAAGKFDQYKRDIPYATLAQAFQSLVRQLLGRNEAELGRWRQDLLDALGPSGGLIVNLIPELALIIGEQPPVPDLPPQEAQNRFYVAFRRFLGVFARPEHPLALFLDDLQWLDTATLELIERMVAEPGLRHLLLVCAYRDNEIHSAHPFTRTLEVIRSAGDRVREIIVAPLELDNVRQFVADALRAEPERVRPLAKLVFDKTRGNPFFAIQFVTALSEEGLLAFDPDGAAWQWDIDRIRAKGISDNVVALVADKLNRFPAATLDILKQVACLGSSAHTGTLSTVLEISVAEIHAALWEVVRAGLIFRLDGSFVFVHDRVQEAAYALIPEDERSATHLRIGRVLASRTAPAKIEENIFEIVNHFNRGAALIDSAEERERLAKLNLIAGERARTATANASALAYFATGAALLPKDSWERCYELTFSLNFQQAECEYLTGDLASAQERLAMLSSRAASPVDNAAVTCLGIELYTNLDQPDRAVQMGLEYLQRVGIKLPPRPTDTEVRDEYERIRQRLGTRSIEELIDLPPMADPVGCATLDVLTAVHAPANFIDGNLLALIIGRMANLSLEHGHSGGSGFAYVYLGMILGHRFAEYRAGFRFGKLGVALVEQGGSARMKARAYLNFGNAVNPWARHVRTNIDLLRRALDTAREAGDLTFVAYSYTNLISARLAAGDPLADIQSEVETALSFVKQIRFGIAVDMIQGQLGLIRALRGLTSDLTSFNHAEFDERSFEKHLEADPRLAMATCWYWIRKLQGSVLAGSASAIVALSKAKALLWTSPAFLVIAEHHFYGALARAAQYDEASDDERPEITRALRSHLKQLGIWAESCPENFQNRRTLIAAEIARIENRDSEAMRFYEDAIQHAREHGFIQIEALGNELAARFYAARDFRTIADAYLRSARGCYQRWGADGKVKQLERLHPQLRVDPARPASTMGTPVEQLDLATVVKVSEAVSGEIDFKKLIDTLMVMALEHAGAERGLLILPRGDELEIAAEAITVRDRVEVRLRRTGIAPTQLPESVLRYVVRARDSVLLDDASNQNPFFEDDYFRQKVCRSILCLPLTKQAKLIGVLYLENSLTSGVFTPARIAVLRLLASQAAISLENAQLYADLKVGDAYLKEAQRLSHTGSFGWNVATGEIVWSEETFRIFELDRTTRPTLDTVIRRTHPDDVERIQLFLGRVPDDGTDWNIEHRLLMPDGSVKSLHVVARAVRDEAGELAFVGAVMDITAARRAEEAVREVQSELAHITRVTTLGEMAATIAHEVNQPLATIVINGSACLRWLDRETPALDKARNSVESMIREAERASEVIRRVRTLSKNAEPEKTSLGINDLVRDTIHLVQREATGHGALLRLELAPALPPVFGDRVQLQQVIINLVVNGIQAMTSVTEWPREILIRSDVDEFGHVQVEVADTGSGIDAKSMNELFRPFFTTKPTGMGMGLSICRSIIEAHGGRMGAYNNTGPGATFYFTVPSNPENAL